MYKMIYMVLNSDKFGLDKLLTQLTAEDLDSEFTAIVFR